MASNQYFPVLPSMPSQGGGNPSGMNFMGSDKMAFPLFSGGETVKGGPGGGGSTPPIFNWPGSPPATPGGGGNGGFMSANNPYQVPSQQRSDLPGWTGENPQYAKKTPGYHQIGPLYPGLSGGFAGWLESQLGSGVSPFDLSTPLPTGGATQPGQLTAGENPLLQALQSFYQGTGPGLPGMSTLQNVAQSGVSGLPAWDAMIKAQQQNISQNQANLKEQFGSMGDLAGSPFGTAMSNYMQQTTADQNSLLGQLQMQGILQGQLPAAQFLSQSGAGTADFLQQLNQQAIQNQYGEFVRTSPQYNPALNYMTSMAQFMPGLYKTGSGGGLLGGLLGNAGTLAGIGSSIGEGLSGGGGITDVLSSLAGMLA